MPPDCSSFPKTVPPLNRSKNNSSITPSRGSITRSFRRRQKNPPGESKAIWSNAPMAPSIPPVVLGGVSGPSRLSTWQNAADNMPCSASSCTPAGSIRFAFIFPNRDRRCSATCNMAGSRIRRASCSPRLSLRFDHPRTGRANGVLDSRESRPRCRRNLLPLVPNPNSL